MRRSDLAEAEWARIEPFLPGSDGRCDRWRNHRQVIDGILYRVRTSVRWRDLPSRFGPWETVCERHRLWSADGTWERLLQRVQGRAAADAAGGIGWDIAVDFTIVWAHQHTVGARTDPPPTPASKGAEAAGHQAECRGGSSWPDGWRWCEADAPPGDHPRKWNRTSWNG
ncbi:IS5 family transposase [Streptomyces sp. NPDC052676]|uniref:IS5 family transposase n=1 Tax=Streptomyces sp. NPDC052676 TaxID=3154953 RepID=UPI003416794D